MDHTGLLLRPSIVVLALFLVGVIPSTATASEDSDLSVSVTSDPEPVPDHTQVTYTVTATNAGPRDAYAIVHNTLPEAFSLMSFGGSATGDCVPVQPGISTSVSCDTQLLPGASKTLTVTAEAFQCVTNRLTDQAGIDLNSSNRTDPNPANNTAQVTSTMVSTNGFPCEALGGNVSGGGGRGGGGTGGGGGIGGGGVVATPLKIDRLVMTAPAFRAALSGPSLIAAKATGTQVTYRLSKAAAASFYVWQRLPGRLARGKCVRPTRANLRSRLCARLVALTGHFAQAGAAGANHFRFTGRFAGRKLRPGRYQLVGYARDAAAGKTSLPARASFSIVP